MRKLSDAFGATPPAFDAFVEAEVSALCANGGKRRRPHARVAALAFAFALLAAGVVLAISRGVGVFDLVPTGTAAPLPESTPPASPSGAPGVKTSRVTFQVRDAMLDDTRFMITLEITPKNQSRHILLPLDATPFTPVAFEGEEATYLSMAEETGKAVLQVTHPTLSINGSGGQDVHVSYTTEANRLVYHAELYGIEAEDGDTLDIRCSLFSYEVWNAHLVYLENGDTEVRNVRGDSTASSLRFSMDVEKGETELLRFDRPAETDRLQIDFVEVRRTSLATYLKVRYTVKPNPTQADLEAINHMTFILMEGDAAQPQASTGPARTTFLTEPSPDGAYAGAVMEEETTWPAMDASPEALTLRPYFRQADAWGDAIVLSVADDEG